MKKHKRCTSNIRRELQYKVQNKHNDVIWEHLLHAIRDRVSHPMEISYLLMDYMTIDK